MSSAPQMSSGLSKLKKKHFRVKHQKVKLFRANEPLLSVFMWGVNHTINELSHVNIPVMLLPDDFRAYSKLKVDNHLFNKENMPSHFKIKEYCPLVFRNLRERFGIDDLDYKESMTRCRAFNPSLSERHWDLARSGKTRELVQRSATTPSITLSPPPIFLQIPVLNKPLRSYSFKPKRLRSQPILDDSSGKSGAKFYQSYDKLFIIKTLTSEEVERMHSFLKHYHPYIVERHGKTLLPQYLGMYRLTVDGVEHYVVAIRNVFSNHLTTHKKFDLKGSTVDREASDKEKEKDLPTYKDNDFVKEGMKIYIGEEAKAKLIETLTADVDFLTRLHLMDYSLLLGLHDCARAEQENRERAEREEEEDNHEEEDDSESGSGLDSRGPMGDRLWGWSGVAGMATPPESPHAALMRDTSLQYEDAIIPELDIYAIPSKEGAPTKEIYFLAIIDVLTHYGVRKQAAKAAKTVKYGANVDGISTCDPEQYGKRFIEFMSKAIE
ncbi:Phosphatidylinositol 5-phosphate 4-kinase type-2 beta [Habropoda laboriosa]|uniref:Phosphatidylinositol 5-phosphate 4-kinase type-2 beta n=1 Tax=Habropoda laboriosa TaxID=597456 RepID=A0A0L7RD28_9HYME|nr:PREDICTED: phosphatidylinositol 5-phosphate 4-kinase type-2 alpha [Habropoda laboriosa]KOC68666.1 Phosphatidylinositol 5-phosphate 4-kinase type-2 beta [Habropoda laboriosa]